MSRKEKEVRQIDAPDNQTPLVTARGGEGTKGVRIAAGISMTIGAVWLILWLTGVAPRWSANGVLTTKANMALGQFVAGFGLFILAPLGLRRLLRVLGALAAVVTFLIGSLTFSEHLFQVDLGIDQLLASEIAGAVATVSPNRMGPFGSSSLVFLGMGLAALALGARSLVPYPALAACLVNLFPAIGYLNGVHNFYSGGVTGIAFFTIIALLALGIGLLLAVRERGPMVMLLKEDPGGALLRRMLLPTIGLPLILGFLRLQGERLGWYSTGTGIGLLVLTLILAFSLILWRNATHFSRVAATQAKAQRELSETNQRLQALMRALPVGVSFSDDSSCQRITGNPAVLTQFGATPRDNLSASALDADALGRQIHFSQDGREVKFADLPLHRAVRENKEIPPAEYEVRLPNGRRWFMECSGAPVRNPGGAVVGGIAVTQDITARRQAEDALEQTAQFPNQNPNPVLRVARDGILLYANRSSKELVEHWGCATGKPVPERIQELVLTTLKEERVHEFDEDLGDRAFLFAIAPFPTRGYTNLYGYDITSRKKTEAALREAQKQLRAHAEDLEKQVARRTASLKDTVNELEHFSYAITHDMRAPLRAMQGFASLLDEERGSLSPMGAQYLQRIRTAANRLDQLITDSLNYSKAVRQELTLEPVDLGDLLEGILETYPNLQPERADIQAEANLPTVLGNEAALTQCFSNLLGNAVKFAKPGLKPVIRIRAELPGTLDPSPSPDKGSTEISARIRPGYVRIWVEDNGIGIPRAYQQRIFGMFQRATRGYEGTGIGLAIVRKVAQRMGGQVGVESEEGFGSRFWLDLRLAVGGRFPTDS